ncbi:MAG: tetratricopeptide repeat protein [Lachnospiraceae bacterium]|nr:tetratricopeptide repeat protein [Lachnospiraceae bacterium]
MKELQTKKRRTRAAIAIVVILVIILIAAMRLLPGNRLKRLMKQGNEYLLQQEYEKAVIVFTKALKIDDKNATAYFARGDAYAGLGQTQKARLDYIRAEELNAGMAAAVEQKLGEMNERDLTGNASGQNEMEGVSSGGDSPAKAQGSEETPGESDSRTADEGQDSAETSGGSDVKPAADAGEEPQVVFNKEAMNAASYAGDPGTFPSREEMILAIVDVYNTYQASSEAYREERRGPMTVYYDKADDHIACIIAPAGTYEDHANAFEHTLDAQYYYRLKDDGSVEPAFIYLADANHTEVHMIYLWEGRVIRYVGPVDSSDYRQDYDPGLTIEEFAGQVPQGVFAANACLELSWLADI